MRFLSLLIVLVLATSVAADAIVLRDGTRLEGSIKKTDGGWQVTSADGKVTQVPASNVKSIELGSRSSQSESANVALASLRRSVEALGEIGQIIERYERFIASTKDTAAVSEAQKDLTTWKDRQAKGLVKQGDQWVTPEEASRLREQALEAAAQARDLLRQARVPDAESAIQQALDIDPNNPAAMYLRAVLLYRQDKLVDARKCFETVSAAVPNHAPTLNNLAVILWRQNASGGALSLFDQAMQAQPVNRFILDNVAEALGTLQENDRRGQAMQRVIRRFTEQDTLLQKQLAPQGLYRWGATWVDQKQLDELKAAEKEIRDRVAQIETDFESSRLRIRQIDDEVAANERYMNDIRARSIWRDSEGKLHYMPLPTSYYEYQNKNQQLKTEQQSLQTKLMTLRETAQRMQQQLPTPRFTGVMQIVGVEGTPLLDSSTVPPATMPS